MAADDEGAPMTTMRSTERVRALADQGTLDARDAAQLLEAIETKPSRTNARTTARLVDPFAMLSTPKGVALATFVALASMTVGRFFGVRFDGFLDLHRQARVSWGTAAVDQVAAVVLPTFVFFAVAIVLARGAKSAVRLVDFFVTIGVARMALPLCAIPLGLLGPSSAAAPKMSASLLVVLVVALVALASHLTWLWQGFKAASGLTGARAVTAFVIGIAIAESLSKLLLSLIG